MERPGPVDLKIYVLQLERDSARELSGNIITALITFQFGYLANEVLDFRY